MSWYSVRYRPYPFCVYKNVHWILALQKRILWNLYIAMTSDIFVPEYSKYSESNFEDDLLAVEVATNVARHLLQEQKVTAQQIIGLGHALYALGRFPVATPGINVSFGVVVEGESRSEYIDFHISEDVFEICQGGMIDTGVGHDSYSLPGWYIERNGYRETKCELYWIEEVIAARLANNATKIRVFDDSNIDNFDDEEPIPLNYHPTNQKAKQLLQHEGEDPDPKQLYILQLMHFGLQSIDEQMRQKRQQIRSTQLMQKLEDKVKHLQQWNITEQEVMSWLLVDNDPSALLKTDDLIEGATAVLWMVINRILIDISEQMQLPIPQTQKRFI